MVSGEGLQPPAKGARVKFSGDRRSVADGPFTETKELIAEAIEWAKRCQNPTGEVTPELREQEERQRAALAKKKS